MHPFIIRDAPGSCPICGMALTPVKAGTGGSSEEGIRIDPVTLQNMGVRTEKAARRQLQRTIHTVGLVAVADDRQYAVTTKIEGWVDRLHINQLGQPVKKGQPLLEIYSPDLVATQQEYLLAAANRRRLAESPYPEIIAGADRMLEASRTRLRFWDISEEQLRALERTGQVRKTLVLTSEHGGIVTEKKVLAGSRVMAGEELLRIADLSTVWINADLYEYEMSWVKVGQAVRVELPLAGGKTIDGRIAYIYPVLESETRTLKARIEVANPGLELKPAMYAQVNITVGSSGESLVVPANAVLNSGKGQTVFVAKGEGKFEPRIVTSGLRDDDGFVQILSGLSEGETVVVSAQFMLDSESRLREALDKMTSPLPHSEHGTPGKPDAKALNDLFK
jgi:Cu(I)/Ag(I) efflux system membrane fusion protein/cobalt-zinc-cadmium efflux system membrane fusion protein